MRPYPPKTYLCGERLYTFKAKLRHQATCSPVREQRRRDAAADAMEREPWERKP